MATQDNGLQLRHLPYLIFLLAFILRLYFWPDGLFHTDSVIAAQNAERGVSEGRVFYLQGRLGYPAYAFFNTALFYVANKALGLQSSEQLFILVSMAFASLSVVLLYNLTRELTGSWRAGVYSAIVLCFMPLHLSLSTYVKDQMMGACAMLLALTFALRASRDNTLRSKMLAVLFIGLAVAIRQQEFLLLPSFLVIYFWGKNPLNLRKSNEGLKVTISKSALKYLTELALIIVSVILLFVMAFLPRMYWEPRFDLVESFKGAGGEQVSGFSIFSKLMTEYSLPWATATITWLGWAILAYSHLLLHRKNRMAWAAMALWMVPYFLILGNFNQVSPYFIFPAFIPAAFFIGWGLSDLGERWGERLPYAALLGLCIWMLLNIAPVLDHRSSICGPCEFAKRIGEATPPGSLVESADESRHIEYYGGRRQYGMRPDPLNGTAVSGYLSKVSEIIDNGSGFYITTMGFGNDYLPRGILAASPQDQSMPMNLANGRVYENIRAVSTTQGVYFVDRQTGMPLPSAGLYGLELLNRFRAVPVLTFENEDWHHKDLELDIYNSTLYRLETRK